MPETQTATAERRIVRRRSLKKGVMLTVRRGTMGLGPNLAAGGVELSDDGIQVKVKSELKKGDEVEVGLTGVGRSKPISMIADVRWCRPTDDGDAFRAGIRFRRRIAYSEMSQYV